MVIAISICLLSTAFDLVALPISEILTYTPGSTSPIYSLASSSQKKLSGPLGYTHCSLLRLVADTAALPHIKETVHQIWMHHKVAGHLASEHVTLKSVQLGPVCHGRGKTTVQLPFIEVEHSEFLDKLYAELQQALQPFHKHVHMLDAALGFHKGFPMESYHASCRIEDIFPDFPNQNESTRATPIPLHIPLGACPPMENNHSIVIRPTEVPLRGCRLVVAHLGGHASCHELL
eukprot:gene11027-7663_t